MSRSFLWQGGSHQALHTAGRDLTGSLKDAPHPPDLLTRVLKNSLLPGLLKKVQMQGGARGGVRGVLGLYVAAPRERRVPIRRMGVRRWAFFSSLLRDSQWLER